MQVGDKMSYCMNEINNRRAGMSPKSDGWLECIACSLEHICEDTSAHRPAFVATVI